MFSAQNRGTPSTPPLICPVLWSRGGVTWAQNTNQESWLIQHTLKFQERTMKGGKHVLHTSSFSRVHIQPCDAQALKDDSLHTLTHQDEEGNVWSPGNTLTDWSWSARTLTWKHYLANKQRCWFQWSPCCPHSWCRRPGCRGSRRRPDKRWSGTLPARQADLETITPQKDETV